MEFSPDGIFSPPIRLYFIKVVIYVWRERHWAASASDKHLFDQARPGLTWRLKYRTGRAMAAATLKQRELHEAALGGGHYVRGITAHYHRPSHFVFNIRLVLQIQNTQRYGIVYSPSESSSQPSAGL